jgi:hypothetical protein
VFFWFITIVYYLLAVIAAFLISIVISFVTILPFVASDEAPVIGGLFWLYALLLEVCLLVPLSLALTAEIVERNSQARRFSWPKACRRCLVALPIAIGPLYTVLFVVFTVKNRRTAHWLQIGVLLNCVSAAFVYLALRISHHSDSSRYENAVGNLRQGLIEFFKLSVGFSAVGFSVAILQIYIALAAHGNGFGFDAIFSACAKAAIFGVILGNLSGMVVYYFVLRRHVSVKQMVTITAGNLILGCLGGLIFDWYFVFATPLLSTYIAWSLKDQTLNREAL